MVKILHGTGIALVGFFAYSSCCLVNSLLRSFYQRDTLQSLVLEPSAKVNDSMLIQVGNEYLREGNYKMAIDCFAGALEVSTDPEEFLKTINNTLNPVLVADVVIRFSERQCKID